MSTKTDEGKVKLRRAKGDILLNVLERIAEGVGDFATLFVAIMEAGYGASHHQMERAFAREQASAEARARTAALERETRRKYKKLLSSLKKDGLIAEWKGARGNLIRLTRKGIAKLVVLRTRKRKMLPSIAYEAEQADVFTIVAFDVPERERKKRDWLRAALRHSGFTCVQKSVWMGKIKVPRELLEDIRRLHIADFVEIFQITKQGTLKQLE